MTPPVRGWRAGRSRCGFTLLEVLVVLLLLGLAFALVVPSFRSPRDKQDDAVQRLIDEARRLAVQRAGTVTLSVQADGGWTIESQGSADVLQLEEGRLELAETMPLRVHVSALGACTVQTVPGAERSITIDPVRCRIVRP